MRCLQKLGSLHRRNTIISTINDSPTAGTTTWPTRQAAHSGGPPRLADRLRPAIATVDGRQWTGEPDAWHGTGPDDAHSWQP